MLSPVSLLAQLSEIADLFQMLQGGGAAIMIFAALYLVVRAWEKRDTLHAALEKDRVVAFGLIVDDFKEHNNQSQGRFQGQLDKIATQFDQRLDLLTKQNQKLHEDHFSVTKEAVKAIASIDNKNQSNERAMGEVVGQVRAVGEQVRTLDGRVQSLDGRVQNIETVVKTLSPSDKAH